MRMRTLGMLVLVLVAIACNEGPTALADCRLVNSGQVQFNGPDEMVIRLEGCANPCTFTNESYTIDEYKPFFDSAPMTLAITQGCQGTNFTAVCTFTGQDLPSHVDFERPNPRHYLYLEDWWMPCIDIVRARPQTV